MSHKLECRGKKIPYPKGWVEGSELNVEKKGWSQVRFEPMAFGHTRLCSTH